MADYGNYKLNSNYSYTAPDPAKSKITGLMDTNYNKLRKDLQTPGDIQINNTYDKADYTIRDTMGGGGLYGSSIHADAITNNANQRANALSSNAAYAGSTAEQLRNQNNQWLGSALLNESQMMNTWNLAQDRMDKGLMQGVLMGELGNDWALEQIDRQGKWGLDNANVAADAQEDSSLWGGLGSIAGGLLGGWFRR